MARSGYSSHASFLCIHHWAKFVCAKSRILGSFWQSFMTHVASCSTWENSEVWCCHSVSLEKSVTEYRFSWTRGALLNLVHHSVHVPELLPVQLPTFYRCVPSITVLEIWSLWFQLHWLRYGGCPSFMPSVTGSERLHGHGPNGHGCSKESDLACMGYMCLEWNLWGKQILKKRI